MLFWARLRLQFLQCQCWVCAEVHERCEGLEGERLLLREAPERKQLPTKALAMLHCWVPWLTSSASTFLAWVGLQMVPAERTVHKKRSTRRRQLSDLDEEE